MMANETLDVVRMDCFVCDHEFYVEKRELVLRCPYCHAMRPDLGQNGQRFEVSLR